MKKLAAELVSLAPQLTARRSLDSVLSNAEKNLPFIERTVADLREDAAERPGRPAMAVAAGPSLHRKDPARLIRDQFDGWVVAADGALGYCLRNDLVPDYVLTVDPHPTRIVRWFGDPELESRQDGDDYFRRQDLDPHLNDHELTRNRELLELVNRYGPQIKMVISTSASQAVTKRCLDAGMTLYWWNPILDDVNDPNGMTRRLFDMNKVPCIVSGGSVGTSSWVFAHQVLGAKAVVLVGMDLGYPPGTPYENTQYFKEMRDVLGEQAVDAFISVYNPHLKETWYTDPAYYWYRQSLLEMAVRAPCITYNCTEGGTLFGKGIRFEPLDKVLSELQEAGKES